MVLVGFVWFGLVWVVAQLCVVFFVFVGSARFCLLLGLAWCWWRCLVSVGGIRHSGSSDQMMVVGVLVAFVFVVVVVVVVSVILLSVEVVVAVVNLK